jgi:hypothetical protein
MALGELGLESGVGAKQFGIGAQRVPKGELIVPAITVGCEEVQVGRAMTVGDLDEESAVGPVIQ